MALEKKPVSREGKNYTLKSSAVRAAREDGLNEGEFQVKESGRGGWYYLKNGTKAKDLMKDQFHKTVAKEKEESKKAKERSPVGERPTPPPVEPKKITKPVDPDADLMKPTQVAKKFVVIDRAKGEKTEEEIEAEKNPPKPVVVHSNVKQDSGKPAPAPRVMKVVPASEMPVKDRPHKSSVSAPTKAVWVIADEMKAVNPNVTRKEVVNECVKRGIAYYTARTQYQQWLTDRRSTK